MITKIGLVAGEILNLLEDRKIPMSISNIQLHLGEDSEIIFMAIGWLVREQHACIIFEGDEKCLALAASKSKA
jgi:hypothetical protein